VITNGALRTRQKVLRNCLPTRDDYTRLVGDQLAQWQVYGPSCVWLARTGQYSLLLFPSWNAVTLCVAVGCAPATKVNLGRFSPVQTMNYAAFGSPFSLQAGDQSIVSLLSSATAGTDSKHGRLSHDRRPDPHADGIWVRAWTHHELGRHDSHRRVPPALLEPAQGRPGRSDYELQDRGIILVSPGNMNLSRSIFTYLLITSIISACKTAGRYGLRTLSNAHGDDDCKTLLDIQRRGRLFPCGHGIVQKDSLADLRNRRCKRGLSFCASRKPVRAFLAQQCGQPRRP